MIKVTRIEELLVFPNIKGENGITKKIYSDYKFDVHGNWIERTQTATYKRRRQNFNRKNH